MCEIERVSEREREREGKIEREKHSLASYLKPPYS